MNKSTTHGAEPKTKTSLYNPLEQPTFENTRLKYKENKSARSASHSEHGQDELEEDGHLDQQVHASTSEEGGTRLATRPPHW